MSAPEHSGFGGKTTVNGPRTLKEPARPADSSEDFGAWVRADLEYKENQARPKYS